MWVRIETGPTLILGGIFGDFAVGSDAKLLRKAMMAIAAVSCWVSAESVLRGK